jgi:DNA polymerase I-like protein with 3'-5' exonuclease and polymerase domains
LLDGARCHFDLWEAARKENNYDASGKWFGARSREAAERQWPGQALRRYRTHKAMNSLIQGSAARQTKRAMRDCWREGLVPMLQLHDELDFSFSSEEQARCAIEIMRETVRLRVPMQVDAKFGKSWGAATEAWVPPPIYKLDHKWTIKEGRGSDPQKSSGKLRARKAR